MSGIRKMWSAEEASELLDRYGIEGGERQTLFEKLVAGECGKSEVIAAAPLEVFDAIIARKQQIAEEMADAPTHVFAEYYLCHREHSFQG